MSSVIPPGAVIDTAAGTGGLVHASVFLAQAFGGVLPALLPRPDLHKCAGARLAVCSACVRQLAPVGEGQKWTSPQVERGTCSMLADVDHYIGLYTTAAISGG